MGFLRRVSKGGIYGNQSKTLTGLILLQKKERKVRI